MKLIVENYNDIKSTVSPLNESTNRKDVFIEGIYAQTVLNRNNRMYPKPIMEREVNKYNIIINDNQATGELNHPKNLTINPERICHKMVELKWVNESDIYGKSKLTNTPLGNLVRNLVIDDGIKLGVSTRGVGTVKNSNNVDIVQEDYFLKCWDVVQDPSAPSAFVNGIMEGKEWIIVDGILTEQSLEATKKYIDNEVKYNRFSKVSIDKLMQSIKNTL